MHLRFLVLVTPLSSSLASAAPHRLEVLFLGDDGHHNPLERYRILKQALGPQGFNLTFEENLNNITRENLNQYDALIVYANHAKSLVPTSISPWIKDGGALVALHSACGNFHPSKEWFDLVGGRFKSHETGEFTPTTVDAEHPITKDLPVLKSWDETYIHQNLTPDRHLLQVREPMNEGETAPEPWTWTREEGKGRVFYTASGHDERCWDQEAYKILVKRAILWTIGEEKAAEFTQLKLPPLATETPEIPDRTHPEIPMMELQKPLSPADSAAHTQVPVGTQLSLFASEPMIVNPIAIDWDSRGRAWVVESFASPSQHIRLHAQRLLIEKVEKSAIPALGKLIAEQAAPAGNSLPLAAVHAIWTLEGLGEKAAITSALDSPHPLIRRHALLALGAADPAVIAVLPRLIETTEAPREQLFVLTTAALAAPDPAISAALWKFASLEKPMDATLQESTQLALRRQAVTLFSADFSQFSAEAPTTWSGKEILKMISYLANSPQRDELAKFAPSAPAGLRSHIEKTLAAPPVINRTPVEVPKKFISGRDAYMKACIECHQADGSGMQGTFPPLLDSEWVKGNRTTMLRILLGGLSGPIEVKGQKYNGVMPGHSHVSDAEIAEIASFVRFVFGKTEEAPISAAEVKALRPDVEKRKFAPWTTSDLRATERK